VTEAQERVKAWIEANPLRTWRKANGETLMSAASAVGVSMMTVQLWENGGMRPSDENMAKLAALPGMATCTGALETAWDSWTNQRPQ
jgi:transcriptional regulator with XRE-family HTH domain